MQNTIHLTDFEFKPSGHGHYWVQYTSPVTSKKWSAITADMPLIDAIKHSDSPKKVDLNILKRVCKAY